MSFELKKEIKGFTLIEIMVVLALIAILGSITIMSDYKTNKYKNSLLVDTEAVSIDIRDMQNRTSNFLQDTIVNNIGYGIFFDLNNRLRTETFFKKEGDFDISELSSVNSMKPIDDFIFNSNNSIKRICLNGCSTKELYPQGKLAIYFIKPRPYAYFSYSDDGLTYYTNLYPSYNAINHACIEIFSEGISDVRRIDVYYIGQISFSYGNCEN